MAQGAFSDFMTRDGHEERLSNLLSDHPNLLQPVAAYLAAKEDDSELLGRVKNAAEGLVIGGVRQYMWRMTRNSRRLQNERERTEKKPWRASPPHRRLLGSLITPLP